MATDTRLGAPPVGARTARARSRRFSAAAWAAIAAATLFVATACWWLSRDRSVPIDDSAQHLTLAIDAYEALGAGH
ncbi:MAG TPA: hypothetical protein VED41_13355, partial [Solirubrobacteraceae bacterium]|nr:hypothetical protein [Solirubrobacteraceae bacterium]